MSGIFFDLPSVRFPRRFRFVQPVLQTLAAWLFRWLTPKGFGVECAGVLREVHSRYNEAEFPSASSRDGGTWNKFDSALEESRPTDGVPSFFGALRPFNHWKIVKDQHELLLIGKTLTPLARWGATQRKSRTVSGAAGAGKGAKKDVLAAGSRVFRERRREKICRTTTEWYTAIATGAQA
jgi:hypothetical protein